MSDTPKVKPCPIYEAMSRKLLGCDSMPAIEKSKMMVRAIKAAKEAVAPRVIELERELAEAQAEIERLALEIENQQYTITCASEENQQLKESLAEARAENAELRKILATRVEATRLDEVVDQLAEANRKLAERINDDQKYLIAPLCNAEKALDDCQSELAEARAEIERKNKLIEQMREALKLALTECRSTHCENEVKAALSAAGRINK